MHSIELIELQMRTSDNIQIVIPDAFCTAPYKALACKSYDSGTTDQDGINSSDTDTRNPKI
jgi:hypothetical protein